MHIAVALDSDSNLVRRAAIREGSAALIRQPRPGRPGKLAAAGWEQAAAWRAQGISDSEIGRRLGVAHTTVARRLGTGAPPHPPGTADTHVTAHDGRAVCFVTGEPSGLSVTLPKALAELTKAAGPAGTSIMVGFDRGGAYAQVFRHCRDQGVRWVTYRRAPLAVPAMLPVITTLTIAGRKREITWAEETVEVTVVIPEGNSR